MPALATRDFAPKLIKGDALCLALCLALCVTIHDPLICLFFLAQHGFIISIIVLEFVAKSELLLHPVTLCNQTLTPFLRVQHAS